MSFLKIYLFGPPHIELNNKWVNLKTQRGIGLIAYLAVSQERRSRETLASLFWPLSNQNNASAALRTTLWRIKKSGLQKWFSIDRESVQMDLSNDIYIDVNNFHNLLMRSENHGHPAAIACSECISILEELTRTYQSGFMQGYYINDSREYEDWQSFHQELLRFEFSGAIGRLVKGYQRLGNIDKALEYANRWLTIDPYHDDAHRLLMQLYAEAGQRESAIRQYNEYVRILKQDLNISPEKATTELFEQIKNGTRINVISKHEQTAKLLFYVNFLSINSVLNMNDDNTSSQLKKNYINYLIGIVKNHGGKILDIQPNHIIALFENGDPINCALYIQSDKNEDVHALLNDKPARIVISPIDDSSLLDLYNSREHLHIQRLCQSAWDGQILITPQVLVIYDLPNDVELIDFGLLILKDLSEPIHILGLFHPSMKVIERRSPRTLKVYPLNLPTQTNPFVGREYEISIISSLLENPLYHLISLVGPGGIGKTRLALQVAANQTENFADGVFYISLNSRTKPELFYPEIGNTLNFRFSPTENPEVQIYNYLRGKQMLIIIDNFENLIQGSIVLIDLIQNLPELKIIITSRERLNLNMEWIQEVRGLEYPINIEDDIDHFSACKLFIQCAQRVFPDFNPEQEQERCIAEICKTVEGSPLAIELAASWVRSLPCCEIAEQVKNNLDFLSTNMQDLPPRHRSLRAVFDHTWGLLSEEERRLLRKLSIFRGSFNLKAAEHITHASLLMLTNCIDKSMLRYIPDGRFEMLETIRFFAKERLGGVSNEKNTVIQDYCNYYGSLMEVYEVDLLGPEQLNTIKILHKEIENIYNTWDLSIENHNYEVLDKCINTIFRYHEIQCLFRDGCEYFRLALDGIEKDDDPQVDRLRIRLQSRLGWFLFRLGHQSEGLKLLTGCLTQVLRVPDFIEEKIFLLNHLGETYSLIGELDKAMIYITESISDIESENIHANNYMSYAYAQALYQAGILKYSLNRLDEARATLLQSISTLENLGNTWWVAKAYNALGVVISKMEDHEQAKLLRQKSLQFFKEIGDKRGIAVSLNNIANNMQALGEIENVIEMFSESLQISKAIGDRRFASIVMLNIAQAYLEYNDDFEMAEQYYLESIKTFQEIDGKRGLVYALHNYADALLEYGKLIDSRKYFRESLEMACSLNDPALIILVLAGIAKQFEISEEHVKSAVLCGYIIQHADIDEVVFTNTNILIEKINTKLTNKELDNALTKGKSMKINDILDLGQT